MTNETEMRHDLNTPLTNADRIRAMSDEELALFQAKRYAEAVFREKEDNGIYVTETAKKSLVEDLRRVWIQYLMHPADELYMKFQILTGYTAEQLLELFAKGYELTPPDPPMSLSEFAFQEDLNIKEETENTNNAHIKIQYNYEELSVAEICERLTEAEARAEKAERERDELFQLFDDVCKDVREKSGMNYVCGLCEYNGAHIGKSGDWVDECPGFERDDCFCMKKSMREKFDQKEK